MNFKKTFTSVFFILLFAKLFGQIPPGYYNSAAGLEGNALKSALHNIIDNHTELSYGDLWDVLPESDEDPNNSNNFILIYTGRSIPKTSEYPDWNREHVWAKSHGDFGTTAPAGTDAHHIRPADVSVNSDRGSLDFDNGGTQHSEATGCYYDSDSWEPRNAVKGDVARMMFYMAVRYEGDDTSYDLELLDYTPTSGAYFGKLSTLLAWNEQDPVDDFERHKNEVVFSYQNNRNPFIDDPGWVNCIWANDCSSVNVKTLSVNNEVHIGPNPVKNILYIIGTSKFKNYQISTVTGQNIINKHRIFKKNISLNLSNLPSGIYFIKTEDIQGKFNVKKIIKN